MEIDSEGREYDRLGRQQPKRVGGALVWFRAVPGMAGEFSKVVPASHIEHEHPLYQGVPDLSRSKDLEVKCPCGGRTSILGREGSIVACVGGCERYFLPTGEKVLCAGPYELDAPVAA